MKSVGKFLREMREERHLLLRQVAAAVEMDTTLLSKIEREERLPTKDQAIKLARYFESNEDEFLTVLFSDRIVAEFKNEIVGLDAVKMAVTKLKQIKET